MPTPQSPPPADTPDTGAPESGARYASTRHAWEQIWDSASVTTELRAAAYPRAVQTLRLYLPYLPKDRLLLEAGSGLSAVVITLRRMGYNIAGLDYAENALHTSRAYDPTLPLLAGDVHALPVAAETLGAYLSFGVLEHFEHGMQPALREAYRVLQPGGVLVLTIPAPNVVNRLIAWRRARRGEDRLNDESFYESTYSRAALTAEVQAVGFVPLLVAPTSHAFTLWGLGGVFRGQGYYTTSRLADGLGALLRLLLPWAFNFSTLVVARR